MKTWFRSLSSHAALHRYAGVAFGDGKYHVTKEWADANDVDLTQCYFYTDSMSAGVAYHAAWHFSRCYWQSKHELVDHSQCGPCNPSDTPREWLAATLVGCMTVKSTPPGSGATLVGCIAVTKAPVDDSQY